MSWLTRQFNRLLRWLHRRFDRNRRARSPHPIPMAQTHIQQSSQGDRNQVIAEMSGGTAIAPLPLHLVTVMVRYASANSTLQIAQVGLCLRRQTHFV